MKKCYKCGETLDNSCFGKNRSKPDGLATECKDCKRGQDRSYWHANKDAINAKQRQFYADNCERLIAKACQYSKENRVKCRVWTTKAKNKLKADVFGHYCGGKPTCTGCGEKDIGVLTIDHIAGNGADHRRELFGNNRRCGYPFYQWLKRNEYPDGFQVLCFNCQFRKRAVELKPENPTHLQEVRARYARSIKEECLDHYGGRVCECGENDLTVLTLDHVNDDGAEHRRETGTRGQNFYHMLRKNGFPNEPPLEVKCLNCQIKKRNEKYNRERESKQATYSDGAAVAV